MQHRHSWGSVFAQTREAGMRVDPRMGKLLLTGIWDILVGIDEAVLGSPQGPGAQLMDYLGVEDEYRSTVLPVSSK